MDANLHPRQACASCSRDVRRAIPSASAVLIDVRCACRGRIRVVVPMVPSGCYVRDLDRRCVLGGRSDEPPASVREMREHRRQMRVDFEYGVRYDLYHDARAPHDLHARHRDRNYVHVPSAHLRAGGVRRSGIRLRKGRRLRTRSRFPCNQCRTQRVRLDASWFFHKTQPGCCFVILNCVM